VTTEELRARWTDVLNLLEQKNRMAWIAFFDARLAEVNHDCIFLDFSDVRKFAGALEYSDIREIHLQALEEAISEITGIAFSVKELP
jgi:hypothetical protein